MAKRRHADDSPPARRRPRRRGWLWIFAALILLLGGAAWFAPAIVAGTSLRDQIVVRIAPDFPGQVSIESASLGWLSPIVLRNIRARDADGQPLFELTSLKTDKTLWDLARDQSDLGQIWLSGLVVHAQTRSGGTNIEDALAPLLKSESQSASPTVHVTITESTVDVADNVTGRRWSATDVQGEIVCSPDLPTSLAIAVQGNVHQDEQSGALQVQLARQSSQTELHIVSENLPLRAVSTIAQRFAGPCDADGRLTSDLTLRFSDATDAPVEIDGRASIADLQLYAPLWLGDDPIKHVLNSKLTTYNGRLVVENGRLLAQQVSVASDIGVIELDGSLPLDLPADQSPAQLLTILAGRDVFARGEIDLASLAAAAPGVLRIREGTKITQGIVQFAVQSKEENQRRAWLAEVIASNMTAESAGRQIAWKKPIVVKMVARDTSTGPLVELLDCQSDFFTASGQGHLHEAAFTADADLAKLAAQLGQIVNLDNVKLAGVIHAGLRAHRGADQLVNVTANAEIQGLQLEAPGMSPWREEKLLLGVHAVVDAPAEMASGSVRSATLTLTSGADTLTAALAKPIAFSGPTQPSPFTLTAQGQLATWAPRLQTVLPLAGWQLTGEMNLTATANASPASVELVESQCDIAKFLAEGHGYYYREQMVRATAAGEWNLIDRRGKASALTVATTTCSLRGDNVTLHFDESGGPAAAGQFAFRSDIRRMLDGTRRIGQQAETRIRGQATGNLTLAMAGGATNVNASALIESFVVEKTIPPAPNQGGAIRPVSTAPAVSPVWIERQLKLQGQLHHDTARDLLEFRDVKLGGSGAELTCGGSISALTTAPTADLSGKATYNLAVLVQRLRPLVGEQLQLAGKDEATFSLRGPLLPPAPAPTAGVASADGRGRPSYVSPDLVATVKVPWESVNLYGLPIGEGTLQGELRRGIFDFQPMKLAVSDGNVNLSPRIYLNESPPVATLDRGPLLENVALTPELCRTWLKFVAPLLADATQCQGTVSADVERASFPMAQPSAGTAAGTITIHGADVRPGQLANQYLDVINRVESVLKGQPPEATRYSNGLRLVHLDEQQLYVQMVDGRIHHQGFTMKIGEVPVVTSGSVGAADQTLDLVAEIAVQDSWVEGRKFVGALQGKSIRVPIRGTVGRPQIDLSVLEQLGQQLLGGAAQRLLNNEVGNLLNALLQPPGNPAPANNAEQAPANTQSPGGAGGMRTSPNGQGASGGEPPENTAGRSGFGGASSRFRPQGAGIGTQPAPLELPPPP